jgi:arylsulfatase A
VAGNIWRNGNALAQVGWLALVAALAVAQPSVVARGEDPRRPNIVLLYADDMGVGDVGIFNHDSKIPTPHLDRLAREGLRLTDAHSSSGICTPSRYALLTGRYHWRKFHDIVNSFDPPCLDPDEVTVAELLRDAGYRTACIGKWHLGWNWEAIRREAARPDAKTGYAPDAFDWSRPIPGGPLEHGFQSYFGDDVPNFPPYTWFEDDRVLTPPTESLTATPPTAEGNWEARPGPMAAGWRMDRVMPTLTERAVAWLDAQRGSQQPFFLYFPFTSPHAPIVPTEEFVGKSQAGGYGDFVVQTDWTVGQVLAALDRNGFAENTLVIFTADNGPEGYAYPRVRNFQHRSMGPLRGLKRDIWEGGHRVPMIVRWPGQVAADTVSSALTSQTDLFATLAAAVGSELPQGAGPDSLNQLAVWTGQQSHVRQSMVHNTFANHYAVRQAEWLYIDAPSGEVTKVPAWFAEAEGLLADHAHPGALYDLRTDLGQRHNLFAQHPEKVTELKRLLAQIRAQPERQD